MDPTVKALAEQAFAKSHAVGMTSGDVLQSGIVNVAEQTRILFLEEKMKVGTREAAAMQRMDSDKLAKAVLDQRSAALQPGLKTTNVP
jgi:hypothetical protein